MPRALRPPASRNDAQDPELKINFETALAAQAVRVFEFLVGRKPVDEAFIANGVGMSVDDLRLALAALERDRLVVRSRVPAEPGRQLDPGATGRAWVALPPRSVLTPFLAQRRQELVAWERQADALEHMYRDVVEHSSHTVQVDVLSGAEQVGAVYRRLLEGASSELLHLVRPPYLPVTRHLLGEVDQPVVAPTVEMRSVYEADSLTDPVSLETALGAQRHGASLRLTHRLPLKLVVADRKIAMLPARGDDSGGVSLVVHAPAIVGALVQLFEHVWGTAVTQSLWVPHHDEVSAPVPADETRREAGLVAAQPEPIVLDDRTRAILDLMAGGLTDEAIAKALRVSRRTIQADVSSLAATLGARTRFQIALLAAERGLVTARGRAPRS